MRIIFIDSNVNVKPRQCKTYNINPIYIHMYICIYIYIYINPICVCVCVCMCVYTHTPNVGKSEMGGDLSIDDYIIFYSM